MRPTLLAIVLALCLVPLPGCLRDYHHLYGVRTTHVASSEGGDHDADHDHEHEEEGPISPELLAAADRVLVLQTGAGRPSEVLGLVDEHGRMGQEDEALARLRRDAARMGGDAIIHVEFHHAGEHHDEGDVDHDASSSPGDPDVDGAVDEDAGDPMALHLSGTVVRFRDLVQGRHFEVIRRLVVHVPMTDEAQGLAELRREGRALHADLLMDVEFHHGHGSEPLEVDGTAVRFVP